MKKITKNGFLQKTMIAVLIVLCFNFIIPTYSSADIGGILLDPLCDLVCSIGDAVVNVLQKCMTGDWGSGFSLTNGGFLVTDDKFEEWGTSGQSGQVIKVKVDDKEEGFIKGWLGLSDRFYVPKATYSPEQIFAGQVPGLDVNFIHPDFSEAEHGSAAKLQKTIAEWYVALRRLSVVGLLSVLVYVGIRIIISSSAGDKAKYKQFLVDWLIALCILFFMHYIMSFTLTMVDSICKSISGGEDSVTIQIEDGDYSGQTFSTNLLGAARFQTQYKEGGKKLAYMIMYTALVIYTVIFTWYYLKRLLTMAFLTLIAPLVALTYPIDKMGDSKAQAFNSWLKEYIFNALIQPFHLILYMVFIGTAMDLATQNMIYMIAALGFILPAEKLLKSFFGLDKGSTMGALGTIAAGSMLGKFASGRKPSRPSGGGSGADGKGSGSVQGMKIRQKGVNGIDPGALGAGGGSSYMPPSPSSPAQLGAASAAGAAGATGYNLLDDGDNGGNARQAYSDGVTAANAEGQRQYDNLPEEEKARLAGGGDGSSGGTAGQAAPTGASQAFASSQRNASLGSNASSGSSSTRRQRMVKGVRNIVSANGGKARFAKKVAGGAYNAAKAAARVGLSASGAFIGATAGLASGKGISGVIAGAQIGKGVGDRVGRGITEAPENIVKGVAGAGSSLAGFSRKTIDTWNGNSKLQDSHAAHKFLHSAETDDYIRNKLTKENGGNAPSSAQIKSARQALEVYADQGITDLDAIYSAKEIAEGMHNGDAEHDKAVDESSARILALQLSDDEYKASNLKKKDNYEAAEENLMQDFMEKNPEMKEEVARESANAVLTRMMQNQGKKNNVYARRRQEQAQALAQKKADYAASRNNGAQATPSQQNSSSKQSQEIRDKIISGGTESAFKEAKSKTKKPGTVSMPKFEPQQDRTSATRNNDIWTPNGNGGPDRPQPPQPRTRQ